MFYGTCVFKNKRPGFKEQSLPKEEKKIHRQGFNKSSFFPKALALNSVTPASHSFSLKTLFFFLPFLSFPLETGSHYVAQADHKLTELSLRLPQPGKPFHFCT